jgi:ferredoxin
LKFSIFNLQFSIPMSLRSWLRRALGSVVKWAMWLGGSVGWPVLAQQRFPPPEFESGYVLPLPATPPPRAMFMEYADVGVLLAALGLACYFIFRLRSRKAIVGLSLFCLAYFGFYRQGCICAIGSVQNVALGLLGRGYGVPLSVTAFFLAPLVVSLFAGRAFCAAVCPHGALQDLVLLKAIKVPRSVEHGLSVIPYLYLGAGVLFAATGSAFIICRYDPFVPLFRLTGSLTLLVAGGALVGLSMFVGRPYCRFLCPYGALLRLAATLSKWRVRITPDFCTQCRLCEDACPYGAIREPTASLQTPQALALDRARLSWLLLLAPLLAAMGAFGGSKLSAAASRVHPTVELAEKFIHPNNPPGPPGVRTPESLASARAEQGPKELLAAAMDIRRRFAVGGWLFGGWVGLVVGIKLVGLSVRHTLSDYEPDRAACVACARCFLYCPNERVRLGLLPADASVGGPARPLPDQKT